MAESSDKQALIKYDGYEYSIVQAPPTSSPIVRKETAKLLGAVDLQALVDDLGRLGNCVRIAYHGVAGFTDLQIKVQRIGYDVTKLCDKSAITVGRFKKASSNIVSVLESTYQYLLDCLEDVAVESLAEMAETAKGMAEAAEDLHNDFEKQAERVVSTLEETQTVQGTEDEKKKKMEKEREKMAVEQQKAITLHKTALELEQKSEQYMREAQKREDEHTAKLTSVGANLLNAFTSKFFGRNVVNMDAHVDAAKTAKEEKIKHLEKMNEEQEKRRQALERMSEVAEKMKNLKNSENQVEAAIDALQNAIQALKSLSAVMMKAALFWKQMQLHCEELASDKLRTQIEKHMEDPEEKRLRIWTSNGFKKKAIQYYGSWVALDQVCGIYLDRIRETEKELYSYIQEALRPEEAHEHVRNLAATFIADLRREQAAIADKDFQRQSEIKALRQNT